MPVSTELHVLGGCAAENRGADFVKPLAPAHGAGQHRDWAVETHMKTWREILVYKETIANRDTIRRYYQQYREEAGIPPRCDNPSCQFHTGQLFWNDNELPLILDHKDGNASDNRPEMLRYLCPNCDAQLPTRGGKNKGRVARRDEYGFLIIERNGHQGYTFFPTGGAVVGGSAKVSFHRAKPSNIDQDTTD